MFYIGLLRGHKMLMNSGLAGRERVGILTSTGNRTDYKAITTGLRQQWEDASSGSGTARRAGTMRTTRSGAGNSRSLTSSRSAATTSRTPRSRSTLPLSPLRSPPSAACRCMW